EINPVVRPLEGEPVILKNHANAFLHTALKQVLDEKSIEEVVIVGAMSHMCVDATSRAAADFGYKTIILQDACATRDLAFGEVKVPAAQVHAAFMSALAAGYGTVTTASDYLSR